MFQENNKDDAEETNGENGEGEHEQDFLENGRDDQMESPESSHSRNDKEELEEIMDVEANAQNCIRHALSIVSTPASQPGSSPPPLAATAPSGDDWKTENHTRLSPELRSTSY